ncbi:hypothetical protein AWH56_26705 [Anaerobacillus isosaccharinicus]|uniref:Uncharacterized protein n=1 Tax=Anaerobacillus isosaccharinicus TaxID=1532552 RepID=A0AC62A4A0_9BACI
MSIIQITSNFVLNALSKLAIFADSNPANSIPAKSILLLINTCILVRRSGIEPDAISW